MTTLPINEKVQDNGHDSASDAAAKAEAERLAEERAAAEKAAAEEAKRRRSPVYHVFEGCQMLHVADVLDALGDSPGGTAIATTLRGKAVPAWVPVKHKVNGATDRKAIESVIGTAEDPVDGFDEKRRLHKFVAVLTRHWEPRKRKRTVTEDWA